MNNIGIRRIEVFMPENIQDSTYISDKTGIPKDVIENKFGIIERRKATREESVSYMAIKAAKKVLEGIDPLELDLVVYCGSEYKDYYLYNLAAEVQNAIGAKNANAFEIHSLCSAGVYSLKVIKSMMQSDPKINKVLLVSSSKETDLINFKNQNSRFMFSFGDGAAAAIIEKGINENIILETSMITDGSFAQDVGVYTIGSKNYGLEENKNYYLDVQDPQSMKERLDKVTFNNFVSVIRQSVKESGFEEKDIDFVAPIFMKRSILNSVLAEFDLKEENSFVLDKFGHCQSADAYISIKEANKLGRIKDGDIVVMLGAGTGYTWAATAVKWGKY